LSSILYTLTYASFPFILRAFFRLSIVKKILPIRREIFSRPMENVSRPLGKFPRVMEKFSRAMENFPRAMEIFLRVKEKFPRAMEIISRVMEKFSRAMEMFSTVCASAILCCN